MTFDNSHWQTRLDTLRAAYGVPAASLAVLVDGEIHELAGGVLHRGTGVEATTDSIFQLGSVSKVLTATLVMQLAESGQLDLDAPVSDILPGFRAATTRQLLNHTSGISGDFSHDTGRGDDCVERYVEASHDVGQDFAPGLAISYSSTGYVALGRIVEVLTGLTWDEALKRRLLDPLGMTSSVTLPEDALRFHTAVGHENGEPVGVWSLMPRSAGPAGGTLCSTAADLIRFARMHLDDGLAPDGTRVLAADTVAAMQAPGLTVPDRWTVSSDGWGLGWSLYDWDGTPGFGHDGAATGQYAYLRVAPGARVAVALLTNGGDTRRLYADLVGELLTELAGVSFPAPFQPSAQPPAADVTPLTGTYLRDGVRITVSERDTGAHLRYEFIDGMAVYSDPLEADLVPVSDSVFAAAGTGTFSGDWMPVVFSTLTDGTRCVYVGLRATPKVA